MVKLRKQRKRKVYRHNVNRKRLRNKIVGIGSIGCKEIKDAWENKKSLETNLSEMGLSYDPNKSIKIPNTKKALKASLLSNDKEWKEELLEEEPTRVKGHIAQALEEDAKAPRERKFRLPKSQIEWLTYLMKKYENDYKAMAKDKKNYNQETWKQIRQKIKQFKGIPEQYNKYLKEMGLESSVDFDLLVSDEDL